MTLQKREKTLAIATAALLAILAFYWFWPSQGSSLSELRALRDAKQAELNTKEKLALQVKKAKERVAAWQTLSLPAELETARSLYKSWLNKLAHSAGINPLPTLTVGDGQVQKDVFAASTFNIQCQGTLEQLTKFMHEFYSAGHLHKIRNLTITPLENSRDHLNLNIFIETLSLPGSTQKNKLSAEPGKRLKMSSLDDYKKAIVGRNLFAAYAPKSSTDNSAKESKPTTKLDPLQFSYLTAIIEADGIPEAWLFERSTGETLKVHEGEEFTIGKVRGKVIRIGYNEIEIEIDGKSHTVGYGNSLKM
jgi:Tfp pilus assembly protein PilO